MAAAARFIQPTAGYRVLRNLLFARNDKQQQEYATWGMRHSRSFAILLGAGRSGKDRQGKGGGAEYEVVKDGPCGGGL
jgi:hypothetical protein